MFGSRRTYLPTKRGENRKAGLAVATINIPLSISLALASGLDPLVGLLTGIRGCAIAALTASSKHNVFGIAGALSGIILLFVREFGAERVPLLTIISGLLTILIRLTGIVKYITLIPSSALHGFVIGVGLIILTNQLPDLVGLHTLKSTGILSVFQQLLSNINSRDRTTVTIGLFALVFLLVWKAYVRSIPGVLVVTILGALLGLFAEQIGLGDLMLLRDKYPNLQFSLFAVPTQLIENLSTISLPLIMGLLKTGAIIAIIAIVETIVSAKIATKMTKVSFDKEQEVTGLGITNLLGGILGIAPATAVFVRTLLNIRSGATEKSAAFITAIATALISIFLFKNFFLYLPLTVIAAILISIAIGMVNIRLIHHTTKVDRAHGILMVIVALITLFEDPMIGILTGIGGALLLQIAEKTKPHLQCAWFTAGVFQKKGTLIDYSKEQKVDDVLVVKLPSEITYLNSDTMISELHQIHTPTQVIFSCSQLYSIDIDGLEVIDEMIDELAEDGCVIHLTGTEQIQGALTHLKRYTILKNQGRLRDNTSQCLESCFHTHA